jgi:hypothetical protein
MHKEVLKQLYPTPPFGECACNKECFVNCEEGRAFTARYGHQ